MIYNIVNHPDFTMLSLESIKSFVDRCSEAFLYAPERMRVIFASENFDVSHSVNYVEKIISKTSTDPNKESRLRAYLNMVKNDASQKIRTEAYLQTTQKERAATFLNAAGLYYRESPQNILFNPGEYTVKGTTLQEIGSGNVVLPLLCYSMQGNINPFIFSEVISRYPVKFVLDILSYAEDKAVSTLDFIRKKHSLSNEYGTVSKNKILQQAYSQIYNEVIYGRQALHRIFFYIIITGSNSEAHTIAHEISTKLPNFSFRKLTNYTLQKFALTYLFNENLAEHKLFDNFRHNMTSRGAGILLASGLGFAKKFNGEGVYWGISTKGMFFWYGFGTKEKPEPNMAIILGSTGSGKTNMVNAVAMRYADITPTQVIMLEPMGHSIRPSRALAPHSLYWKLGTFLPNPCIMIFEDIGEQTNHLCNVFSIVLQRNLNESERAAIQYVCELAYSGITPLTPIQNQPTPEIIINMLSSMGNSGVGKSAGILAQTLSYLIRNLNFKPYDPTFVLNKNIKFVACDFSAVYDNKIKLTLAYYSLFSLLNYKIKSKERSNPHLIIIDEFDIMAASTHNTNQGFGQQLLDTVARMYKSYRTYATGVWTVNQNAVIYNSPSGKLISNNTNLLVCLSQQSAEEVEAIKALKPQITDEHGNFLLSLSPSSNDADKGAGIIVTNEYVSEFRFRYTDVEMLFLKGS